MLLVPPFDIGIIWSAVMTAEPDTRRGISLQGRLQIGQRGYLAISAIHSVIVYEPTAPFNLPRRLCANTCRLHSLQAEKYVPLLRLMNCSIGRNRLQR